MSLGFSAKYFLAAQKYIELSKAFVTVTLLKTRGHAPQEAGAKMIVATDGLLWGTVGGGKLEAKAISLAQNLMSNEAESGLVHHVWNLQRDVGMSCGGEVEILFERVLPSKWKIWIFGAGHVAQSLLPILAPLSAHIRVVDTRAEWLEKMTVHLPRAELIHVQAYEDAVEKIENQAFVMVMTMGHKTDFPVLKKLLLRQDVAVSYVGVLGSLVKAKLLKKELLDAGVDSDRVESLRCPMGLPIGSNDPAEMAISLAAEVLQQRDQILGCLKVWTESEK